MSFNAYPYFRRPKGIMIASRMGRKRGLFILRAVLKKGKNKQKKQTNKKRQTSVSAMLKLIVLIDRPYCHRTNLPRF